MLLEGQEVRKDVQWWKMARQIQNQRKKWKRKDFNKTIPNNNCIKEKECFYAI